MGDPPRRAAHTPYPCRGLFFHNSTGICYHYNGGTNKDSAGRLGKS